MYKLRSTTILTSFFFVSNTPSDNLKESMRRTPVIGVNMPSLVTPISIKIFLRAQIVENDHVLEMIQGIYF